MTSPLQRHHDHPARTARGAMIHVPASPHASRHLHQYTIPDPVDARLRRDEPRRRLLLAIDVDLVGARVSRGHDHEHFRPNGQGRSQAA